MFIGDLSRPIFRPIRTAVKDEKDFIFFGGHVLLGRQRPEASTDEVLFIAGWYYYRDP